MKTPALFIAGASQGCGKTAVTLGLMAALTHRHVKVQPFTCGPDFSIPALHKMVCGQTSRNLDLPLCGRAFVQNSFARRNLPGERSIAIVESSSGLFDGGAGSPAELARVLNIPLILVVDVSGMGESIAALVKGYAAFDARLKVAGLILNRVRSAQHAALMQAALKDIQAPPIVGLLPEYEGLAVPEIHPGPVTAAEKSADAAALGTLAQLIRTRLDTLPLLAIAGSYTPEMPPPPPDMPVIEDSAPVVRIGVAKDEAFSLYYEDNLELLHHAGAELVFFSPIKHHFLPPGLSGLYLGGGHPEFFAGALSANGAMRAAVRSFCATGAPVYAECGGFAYLCQSLSDSGQKKHAMCAVFPLSCVMAERPRPQVRKIRQSKTTCLGAKGASLSGHEYSYPLVARQKTPPTGVESVWQADGGRKHACGLQRGHVLASVFHLHWGGTPEAACAFVDACREYQKHSGRPE